MRNNKRKLSLVIVAMACLAFAGCQSESNINTSGNTLANAPANSNASTNSAPPASGETSAAGTPAAAYKAAYDARKNKDVPALKSMMSKDILKFFTEIGSISDKKQTVDEILMELCEKPQAATAETRNEKIEGNKATVEYLDEKGGWSTMDFIKEDGVWKLTIPMPEDGVPQLGDTPGDKKG
ncbi:MAG: hypothetical protein AB7J13_16825 [Pyrinomonadaceae bacterium]